MPTSDPQMSIAHSFVMTLCRLQEAEAQRERQRAQTPPRASRSSLLTTLIYFAEDGQLSDHIDMVRSLPSFCHPASSRPSLSVGAGRAGGGAAACGCGGHPRGHSLLHRAPLLTFAAAAMACLGLLRRLSAGGYEYDKKCLKRLTSLVMVAGGPGGVDSLPVSTQAPCSGSYTRCS